MKRGLFQTVLILFAVASLFVAGFVAAAEKPAPKATPATAPKAAAKATPKVQPQLGGILKIIEVTGPKDTLRLAAGKCW